MWLNSSIALCTSVEVKPLAVFEYDTSADAIIAAAYTVVPDKITPSKKETTIFLLDLNILLKFDFQLL